MLNDNDIIYHQMIDNGDRYNMMALMIIMI